MVAFALSSYVARAHTPGSFLCKPNIDLVDIRKTYRSQRTNLHSCDMISKDLNNKLSIGAGATAITLIMINR
jgi:hypothetical protein